MRGKEGRKEGVDFLPGPAAASALASRGAELAGRKKTVGVSFQLQLWLGVDRFQWFRYNDAWLKGLEIPLLGSSRVQEVTCTNITLLILTHDAYVPVMDVYKYMVIIARNEPETVWQCVWTFIQVTDFLSQGRNWVQNNREMIRDSNWMPRRNDKKVIRRFPRVLTRGDGGTDFIGGNYACARWVQPHNAENHKFQEMLGRAASLLKVAWFSHCL